MTLLESVRNYFLLCPFLDDGCINVDYLDEEKAYNIDVVPTDPVIQKYVDGGEKRQFTFVFQSREAWGNDTINNLDNNGFYEQLADWIDTNNKTGVLPTLETGKTPYRIELLSSPCLYANTEDSAIYQIQLRLIYTK